MVSKYKKLYQTSIDIISAPCRQWIGFNYKGYGTCTIEYTLCGETEPRQFIINLPGNGGGIAYHDIATDPTFEEGIPCVVEGSVIKITPLPNIFIAEYGNPCP